MLAIGVLTVRPSVPELLAEGIAGLTPLELIERLVQSLGAVAKRLLLAGVLLGCLVVGGALGLVLGNPGWTTGRRAIAMAVVAVVVGLLVFPLLGLGAFGAHSRSDVSLTAAGLALGAAIYLVSYHGFAALLSRSSRLSRVDSAARRAFLRNALLLFGAGAGAVVGVRWLTVRVDREEAHEPSVPVLASASSLAELLRSGVPGLTAEITPNDQFYVVSKNVLRDPVIDAASWRLEVGGLVERPSILTYDDVKALPSATQYFTLQCISNEIGGNLIGNAHWRGTSLAALLGHAGVRPEAVDVVFTAEDGYTDSIPIQKAMHADTMLAYEMNGEVLPHGHGFPVRMLIPDLYGMKNVKWVTKIDVVDYDFQGYWMVRGWTDMSIMNTTSRIDLPKNVASLRSGANLIGGVALAGNRGIQGVEVSTDSGRTWNPAEIKPALGPNTWVLWLYGWDLPAGEPADFKLLVRATDGTGAVQTHLTRETIPDGATGYHAIVVKRTAQG
jgi:DMSO/TMAO reductase YedYZ molybdopterin-dependent catalytic subunit